MAEVYLGVHRGLAGFEKLVILKRILPHLAEEGQFVQMLLDEARLAATLRHPGIVAITDLRRDEETFFLVMEYLRGESLGYLMAKQRAKKLTIPPVLSAYLAATTADALHYAHTATDVSGVPLRLVHRDVTPSNVILTYEGQPKLIDFGIAKAAAHMTYTQPGTIKGKYAYSSPEQVSGKPLDGRSDVFALGVVLHELLTGRRLFKSDNPAGTIRALTMGHIAPPSEISDSPRIFDDIVLTVLSRDVSQRTPSAKVFRDQLNAALRVMGESLRREDLSAWMRTNLQEELQKRKRIEDESLHRARGGTRATTRFSLETSISSSGNLPAARSGSRASLTRRRPVPRLVLLGAAAMVLMLVAFFAGRALNTRSGPVLPTSAMPPAMETP